MKIYDEITKAELTAPDLTKGHLYAGRMVTGHVEDTYEVMPGTVTGDCPEGLRRFIPGRDIYEDCQFYHAYTAEELAEMTKPSLQEQVDANAAAIAELAMMMAGGGE
jgi:hypothetical protein